MDGSSVGSKEVRVWLGNPAYFVANALGAALALLCAAAAGFRAATFRDSLAVGLFLVLSGIVGAYVLVCLIGLPSCLEITEGDIKIRYMLSQKTIALKDIHEVRIESGRSRRGFRIACLRTTGKCKIRIRELYFSCAPGEIVAAVSKAVTQKK